MVLVEAELAVEAFDEVSARRKAERALAKQRGVEDDVSWTGRAWVYDATVASET